jgi:peptidoglycan/xylan/chitin deacetylase (PgdA/CDA1 family)
VGLRQRRRFAQRVDHRRAHRRAREGAPLSAWQALDGELDLWSASGRRADLWWRDDDACRDSPALRALLDTAAATGVPVALAVIPALLEESLVDRLQQAPGVTILQHGYAHRNHAPPGERNWELGDHRPVEAVVAELQNGRTELARRLGAHFVPVLVPPWNRIDARVVDRLPATGFLGLSTFGPRTAARPASALVQCNTHVDLIAWRRGRGFIGADAAIERLVAHLRARREGTVDPAEPTGVLTHHLDLEGDAWAFVKALVARTKAHGAATWIAAGTAFDPVTSARSA